MGNIHVRIGKPFLLMQSGSLQLFSDPVLCSQVVQHHLLLRPPRQLLYLLLVHQAGLQVLHHLDI